MPRVEIERALIDVDSELAAEVSTYLGSDGVARLDEVRRKGVRFRAAPGKGGTTSLRLGDGRAR